MSVELRLQLDALNAHVDRLASINTGALLSALATEGESQTRRRISVEKTAPDGSAWPAWSAAYASTRHAGHKLLENEGHLLGSITSDTDGNAAIWGSNLAQAAAMNFGNPKQNLPAREFLGLSNANESELVEVIEDWLVEVTS